MKIFLFFNLLGYSLLVAISLFVFTIYRPFTYIDNMRSYIICNKDGRKFDIGPNYIYSFTNKLDSFNDAKARKLCEYGLIKDYHNSLETPTNLNYQFHPVYTTDSHWLRAIILSSLVFTIGLIAIEAIKKCLSLYRGKKTTRKDNLPIHHDIVSFVIESLLFSLVWIYSFTAIIANLRLAFPPQPPDGYLTPGVTPEPFEIPLYIILTFLIAGAIYLFHTQVKRIIQSLPFVLRIFVAIVLIVIFFSNLGMYPLKGDISPYANTDSPHLVVLHLITYLSIIAFFILELVVMEKLIRMSKLKSAILFFLTIGSIIFLTFPLRLSISTIDYPFFFGPVWEILQGKTIYTEVSSQYGFLSVLFLTLVAKLHILPLSYTPLFLWILLIVEYFVCFYVVYKESNSLAFSLLALFSLMTINFFTFRIVRTDMPQSGPIRWFFPIFSVYLLYKLKRFTSPFFICIIALFSFWVIDAGLALILAYLSTLTILFLKKNVSLKEFFVSCVMLAGSIIAIFLLIQLLHFAFGYSTIRLDLIFLKLRRYAADGMTMLPIEEKNYFWIAMLFYFASIMYIFRKHEISHHVGDTKGRDPTSAQDSNTRNYKNRIEEHYSEKDNIRGKDKSEHLWEGISGQNLHDIVLLFSANLSLFSSIYFVGRSHPAELYTIAPVFLLNGFILFSQFIKRIQSINWMVITMLFIFISFIVFPAWNRKEALTKINLERLGRLKKGNIFTPEMDQDLRTRYEKEVRMIIQHFSEKEILIISGDDTYLFYLTGKSSLLVDNPLIAIITQEDLIYSVQKAARTCPKKIAVECRLMNDCQQPELYSKAFYFWSPAVLAAVQSGCNLKYRPTECTNQLCIAESN